MEKQGGTVVRDNRAENQSEDDMKQRMNESGRITGDKREENRRKKEEEEEEAEEEDR